MRRSPWPPRSRHRRAVIGGGPLFGQIFKDTRTIIDFDDLGNPIYDPESSGSLIDGILTLSANDEGINIVSAPHILTSDNEQPRSGWPEHPDHQQPGGVGGRRDPGHRQPGHLRQRGGVRTWA